MNEQKKTLMAIGLGIFSSFFLSFTFIINSLLAHSGGSWIWTATLRSFFLIPLLGGALLIRGTLSPLLTALRREPAIFLRWGLVGFGGLYTLLAVASLFAPGWLIAATFQINILTGMLLSPLIYSDHRARIPGRALAISILICLGVSLMQLEKLCITQDSSVVVISILLVVAGAVVWPLGNRKLMLSLEHKGIRLNALQRVLGMTLGSLPVLIVLSITGFVQSGPPSYLQCESSFLSALFAGFLGVALFFKAMQLVNHNPVALSTVEATQVFEIFFALIGEILLTHSSLPGSYGIVGLTTILFGIGLHCLISIHYSKTLTVAEYPETTFPK